MTTSVRAPWEWKSSDNHHPDCSPVTQCLGECWNGPIDDVVRERIRALAKHGRRGSVEWLPWDSTRWLPILTEELGEVARHLCEMNLSSALRQEHMDGMREELIQLAAMAVAWAHALDTGRTAEQPRFIPGHEE